MYVPYSAHLSQGHVGAYRWMSALTRRIWHGHGWLLTNRAACQWDENSRRVVSIDNDNCRRLLRDTTLTLESKRRSYS